MINSKDIIKKYPVFFKYKNDLQKSDMSYGFQCDMGWFNVVEKFLVSLTKVKDYGHIEIVQVKEKFGTLRIHYELRPSFKCKYAGNIFKRAYYSFLKKTSVENEEKILRESVSALIKEAVVEASTTCELCGKSGGERGFSNYWLKTICIGCKKTFENFTY